METGKVKYNPHILMPGNEDEGGDAGRFQDNSLKGTERR